MWYIRLSWCLQENWSTHTAFVFFHFIISIYFLSIKLLSNSHTLWNSQICHFEFLTNCKFLKKVLCINMFFLFLPGESMCTYNILIWSVCFTDTQPITVEGTRLMEMSRYCFCEWEFWEYDFVLASDAVFSIFFNDWLSYLLGQADVRLHHIRGKLHRMQCIYVRC